MCSFSFSVASFSFSLYGLRRNVERIYGMIWITVFAGNGFSGLSFNEPATMRLFKSTRRV
jgi:hypothetical protein